MSSEDPKDEPKYSISNTMNDDTFVASKPKSTDPGLPEDLGSNPILKKIGRLLTNSSGEDWKQGGFEITPEARVPRPIQLHEFVYVRDIKENSIVLRSVTPVSCQYVQNGYRMTALTSGEFSIELRDQVFDADKLVDPKYASNFKGKTCEILATGEVARKLFEEVGRLVKGSTKNVQAEFNQKVQELNHVIVDDVQNGVIGNWNRSSSRKDGREITAYTTTYDKLDLFVSRSVLEWDAKYSLDISLGKLQTSVQGSTPKLIFQILEQQEQDKQLGSLEQKLLNLGLADDLDE